MKEEKNPSVLPPMCNCNKPPVKLPLQVRKPQGHGKCQTRQQVRWKVHLKTSLKEQRQGEGQGLESQSIAKSLVLPPPWLLQLTAEDHRNHNKTSPLLKESPYFSILPSHKGKEEGEYTQPCTSCPIPLGVDMEFSKAISTSHHTGGFFLSQVCLIAF